MRMSDFYKLFFSVIAACGAACGASAVDFASGVLLLNEGQYGKPATICHLDSKGRWTDRVFAGANDEESTLGNTGAFATSYADTLYIVSKQANAAGAILTKADARTLVKLASTSDLGFANCQGRAFLPVDHLKGYAGTSLGVAVVSMSDLSVKGSIEGLVNNSGKAVECGNMLRLDDRVFIATKSKFLYVVDPSTDKIVEILDFSSITGNEKAYAASIVAGSDGALYCSVAGGTSGSTLPYLIKVNSSEKDPSKLVTEVINIPEGIYAPANSWYTWTPDAFCADPSAPALYWNGGASSFKSNQMLFKYDIATGEFSSFYNFPEDRFLYGSAMRVNPADGAIYLAYTSGTAWSDVTTLARLSADGSVDAEWPMTQEYWFPCLPLFPDTEGPVAVAVEKPYFVDADQLSTSIDLRGLATDHDSHDALIVAKLSSNETPGLAEMEVKHGFLTVRPVAGANGIAIARVELDSNGRSVTLNIPMDIRSAAGVESVSVAKSTPVAYRENATTLRLIGSGTAEIYTLSGALVARHAVDGTATLTVPSYPLVVRFAGTTLKL